MARIPPELVDMIVSKAHDNPPLLAVCGLVCRSSVVRLVSLPFIITFTYKYVLLVHADCSNALQPSGVPAHANDCEMPCTGKPAEACGGGNRVHVYFNADAGPAPKTTWEYVGCYTFVLFFILLSLINECWRAGTT
jgi:hypothetical protein